MLFDQDLNGLNEKKSECVKFHASSGVTLLMMASAKGFEDIGKFLIENGADVNAFDETEQSALHYAAVHRQPKMIALLRNHKAKIKPNRQGITSLMTSIQLGTYETVVNHQPNFEEVNISADDGWTAIYFAIRREDEKIFDFLIQQGACVDIKDSYQQSPIDFAKEVGWKFAINKMKKLKKTNRCKFKI